MLRVSALTVGTGTVRDLGARPLPMIAAGEIARDGVLDAAAEMATPGRGRRRLLEPSYAGKTGPLHREVPLSSLTKKRTDEQ